MCPCAAPYLHYCGSLYALQVTLRDDDACTFCGSIDDVTLQATGVNARAGSWTADSDLQNDVKQIEMHAVTGNALSTAGLFTQAHTRIHVHEHACLHKGTDMHMHACHTFAQVCVSWQRV